MYGHGHPHKTEIVSLSTPPITNHMASLSWDGVLKLWHFSDREKNLFIEGRFKNKPVQVVMHPSGFIIMLNFGV